MRVLTVAGGGTGVVGVCCAGAYAGVGHGTGRCTELCWCLVLFST